MTETIDIATGERGMVRLFTLDLPANDAAAFAEDAAALRAALGADTLDPSGTEVLAIRDLSGVGLTGYLTEGMGLDPDAVARDVERLDALTGHVVLVRSAAFGGKAQTLRPQPPLALVGAWQEQDAPPAHVGGLGDGAAAAKPAPSAPSSPPPPPAPGRSRLVMLGLVLAVIVVLAAVALR